MAVKQFLDYAGLQSLWAIITKTFATKAESLGSVESSSTATDNTLVFNSVAGTTLDTVVLAGASAEKAGLMTAADKSRLDSLATDGVENQITFKGLSIDGTATVLTNKVADIALKYQPKTGSDWDGKPYIALYDKAQGGTAISRIDATDFIKDGMLDSATLVVNPTGQANGTYLHLVFNTDAGKTPIFINVTSLIDIYTGGEGITVTGKEIALDKATATTLGGVKTGYEANGNNYAVAVDASGNAYVNVPWSNTEYTIAEQKDAYVTLKQTGNVFDVASTTALGTAVTNANAALNSVAGTADFVTVSAKAGAAGTWKQTIDLDAKVKTSLGLADTAVQGISGANGVEVTGDKDAKVVKLTAATEDRLKLADSAVQSFTIGSKEFSKTANTATAAEFRTAIGLGAAAVKAVDATVAETEGLPTSAAVKTYVDNAITTVKGNSDTYTQTYVAQELGKLDLTEVSGKTAAATGEIAGDKLHVVTAVAQADGKVSASASKVNIEQIANWNVISQAEIEALTGITVA